MRVALLYNERAGRSISAAELCDAILRGGHSLVQIVNMEDDVKPELEPLAELVVAAGGDGTVSSAAALVSMRNVPVAILPLGTANNIAKSLHIEGSVPELIAAWSQAHPVPFDVGVVRSAQGEQAFLESVGGGLVPAVIDSMHADRGSNGHPAHELAQAQQRYRELLPLITPQRWTIKTDGVVFDDELVLLEVLNTGLVGPNLTLSPETSATDGLLSVVVVGEENRQNLATLLDAQSQGKPCAWPLPVMHVRQVDIHGHDALHIDDKVHWPRALGGISLRVEPGALTLLT